jgi:hypothetical protein
MIGTQLNLVTYLGDDAAVTFPFTFPVYDEAHLYVYLQVIADGSQALVDTGDYTVSGIGDEDGGSVVFDTAPASTYRVYILRSVPLTQDLDVENQGGFYPENMEREFDLLEMQIQQLREELSRTIRAPLGEEFPVLDTTFERRGKFLTFADDEDALPTLSDGLPDGEDDVWLLESATGGSGGSSLTEAELIRDTIATALRGLGCVITVDDPGNTITIDMTGATSAEVIRDVIGATLVEGSLIDLTVDDAGNTITIAVNSGALTTAIASEMEPTILTVVSAATVTPTFAYDQVNITAQAAGLTLANPTGTAVDGHGILIRLKDNGTSRAIAYGTKYRTFTDALPSATTINKTVYIGIVYNAADDKWDVLGVRREA